MRKGDFRKVLLEGEWNGKIYGGNVVYVNNEKIQITEEEAQLAKEEYQEIYQKFGNATEMLDLIMKRKELFNQIRKTTKRVEKHGNPVLKEALSNYKKELIELTDKLYDIIQK